MKGDRGGVEDSRVEMVRNYQVLHWFCTFLPTPFSKLKSGDRIWSGVHLEVGEFEVVSLPRIVFNWKNLVVTVREEEVELQMC